VRIEARVEAKSNPREAAIIVDAATITDLLLLKLPPRSEPYAKVTLGNAHAHDDNKEIYTSGFPRAMNYRHQVGKIEAREAPEDEAFAWITDLNFQEGLSGSPVYDEAGKIIGVLKKASGDGITSIIPIGYAESLLAQVRVHEIQQALGDFDALRLRFEWTFVVSGTRDDPQLNLVYKKLVPGDPKISKINVQILPIGESSDQPHVDMGPHNLSNLGPLAYDPDNSGGTFSLPDLVKEIKESKRRAEVKNVKELRIAIVPVLPDDKKLPSTKITVPYELDD
jgi:S1-C subfamily serine protease